MSRALIPLLMLALQLAGAPSRASRFCFAGSECVDFVCGQKVPASDEVRRFVIRDEDRRTYTFGLLEAQSVVPSCREQASLQLEPARGRALPERVELHVTSEHGHTWQTTIAAQEWDKPITLTIPKGTYALKLEAPNFVRWSRTLEIPHPIAHVELLPFPIITGRVIDGQSREPIAGAVLTSDLEQRAVTDASGEFRLAADPEAWPKELTITADGRGLASVQLPAARANTVLGPIALSRAATIEIALTAPDGKVSGIELIEVENHGRSVKRRVSTLTLSGSETQSPRFDAVEPGEYVVLAKGKRPWERIGERVSVAAGDRTKVELAVEPFDVRIRVEDGDARIANTQILIRHRDLHWEGDFETNDAGEALLQLWQGGRLQCTVVTDGRVPYFARRDIAEGDEEWVITLPHLELRGVVVDGQTGEPVPGAVLALRMKSEEGYTLLVDTKADQNGAFRFAPAVYGSHSLSTGAAGYPPTEQAIQFHAPDVHRDVVVKLSRGKPVRIAVVDERERPLAGAFVIVYAGLVEEGRAVTDANGVAGIVVIDGQSRTLFVIPRDGSFAIASVAGSDREKHVRVRDGAARIELRAQSEGAQPVSDVSVVTRYNGTVLPLGIIHALSVAHGWRPTANAEGKIIYPQVPPGTYEFWPVGSNGELLALSAGVGPRAPVTMTVGPGENVAIMSFRRVEDRP